MSTRIQRLPTHGLFWLLSVVLVSCTPSGNDDPSLKAKGAELAGTVITAHLRESHAANRNILWCSTMQLAWDELSSVLGGPVELRGTPLMAVALNEKLASKSDIDDASYLARAGLVKDGILETIRRDVRGKFRDAVSPSLLPSSPGPADIIAYACLYKTLRFETPLLKREEDPLEFGGKKVSSFGLWHTPGMDGWEKMMTEVLIVDYESEEQFMVELVTTSPEDRLILARMKPGSTLKDTLDTAVALLKAKTAREYVTEGDTLLVPAFDFSVGKSFEDVTGRDILNQGFEGYFIKAALQDVRFKLDERGAVLMSEALLHVRAERPPPRRMVFDGPFLLMLMRRGAKMPYSALWVANNELMVPYRRE